MKTILTSLAIISTALFSVQAEDAKPAAETSASPYPLTTCVVTGEKLGDHGKPYVHQHEGREVQFCCKMCLKDFKKDPASYIKKLDEAAAKK